MKRHAQRTVRDLDLTEDEWDLIEKFTLLLKPIEEVSKMLCQDSATISLQYPLAKMIHSALSNIEIPDELINIRQKMLDVLSSKFFGLIDKK